MFRVADAVASIVSLPSLSSAAIAEDVVRTNWLYKGTTMGVILQFLEDGCDPESVGHWSEMGEKARGSPVERKCAGAAVSRQALPYALGYYA